MYHIFSFFVFFSGNKLFSDLIGLLGGSSAKIEEQGKLYHLLTPKTESAVAMCSKSKRLRAIEAHHAMKSPPAVDPAAQLVSSVVALTE